MAPSRAKRERTPTAAVRRRPTKPLAELEKESLDFVTRDPERFARLMADRPIARLGDPDEDIAPGR